MKEVGRREQKKEGVRQKRTKEGGREGRQEGEREGRRRGGNEEGGREGGKSASERPVDNGPAPENRTSCADGRGAETTTFGGSFR